jgi:transcriptional regulator with XRE-family HTH domain
MKERLLEFLRSENKSSAQLAEEIGVQPSGISHILSGRNNPSLDFVLRMLEKYKFLSTDWLLFGKGTMYKDVKMQSLFNEVDLSDSKTDDRTISNVPEARQVAEKPVSKEPLEEGPFSKGVQGKSAVSRIVMFYSDNSYEEYTPRDHS